MEPSIQTLIDKFHSRMDKDEQAREEVRPLKKTINIDLGTEYYSMKLENARISDFKPQMLDEADVTMITTPESLQGLIDGTLRPMKAYITKKISIKGKIQDLMFLKKFF
ncbi:SCP-2 sterol transfer family protein [Candidatus Methanoplasma termitum]|uniref:SCP-2 sterol transfer family protein n=2 Tax=Candidatus Methanoplasma termitum TaxID=1577791 RepID=A0A0A7LEU7_9ARCH|nr:SCP-2 sterol transfer family protein [Candidatus Methanoplasma termitum]